MSDLDLRTGTFSIVGYALWPFSLLGIGFTANVSPQATTFHQFVDYPSFFSGVNNNNEVVGYFTDQPTPQGLPPGLNAFNLPLDTSTTSSDLRLLQPACTAQCFLTIYQSPSFFHSGLLNDEGFTLGVNADYSQLTVFKLGQPLSLHPLDIPADAYFPELNNADQIVYTYPSRVNPEFLSVSLYTIATGKTLDIPTLPGNIYNGYRSLALNDRGQIFGFAFTSSVLNYFLYDPSVGTHVFSPVILEPTSLINFTFFAINDRGQVLFEAFNTRTNLTDWGTLDPVVTPVPPPPHTP